MTSISDKSLCGSKTRTCETIMTPHWFHFFLFGGFFHLLNLTSRCLPHQRLNIHSTYCSLLALPVDSVECLKLFVDITHAQMPPKTSIEKSVVGLLRDPSPVKERSSSRGRSSVTKRSPTPTVAKRLSSVSPSRKSTFVRTAEEGPSAPVATSEEFAPLVSVAPRDWGKLIAIISLEVLFFLWLKWGSDIGLWAAIYKTFNGLF